MNGLLLDGEIDAELLLLAAAEGLPDVLTEAPDWLLDAPVLVTEPTCGCCGLPEHPGAEPTPAAQAGAEGEVRWAVPGVWDSASEPEIVLPRVSDVVAGYVALGEQIAAIDPSLLDAALALGDAEALAGSLHTTRSTLMRRSQDITDRELFRKLGYRSSSAWQRDTAPDTPRSERTLSRQLGTLPWLRDALRERQVSFTAANQLGKALADLRVHLDRPDGLIDELPGEQVVAETCAGALDLLAEHHCGLRGDDPEQAALLARLGDQLGRIALAPVSQLDRIEQLLVLLATELPAREIGRALEHVRLQLLPSVLEDQERHAQHQRELSLKPNRDGTWDLRATLTPEVGEQMYAALASEARRDPANPLDTHARAALRDEAALAEQAQNDMAAARAVAADAQEPSTDGAAAPWSAAPAPGGVLDEALAEVLGENDPWEARPLGSDEGERLEVRTRGQRLQDALGRLLTRYLSEGLGGTSSKVPVQITALINERTVVGAPGAPPARGASGRPLARSLIQRWFCDAKVTVLLMSEGWVPLGLVHTQRTITGLETKAINAQYGQRCPGIGCCTGEPDPLTPLVAHHVDLFSTHGTTSLGRQVPMCENLHKDIHLGKKTVRLRDGSLINESGYVVPPDS